MYCKMTNEQFNQFLERTEQTKYFESERVALIKIDSGYSEQRFDFIYLQTFANKILNFDRDRMEILGVYDKVDQKYYYIDQYYMRSLELEEYVSFYGITDLINQRFIQEVYRLIEENRSNFLDNQQYIEKLTDWEKERLQEEAKKEVLLQEEPAIYIKELDLRENSELFLKIIDQKETLLSSLAINFFEEKKAYFMEEVQKEEYSYQYKQSLVFDKKFQKKREIFERIYNKGMKTLTVTYKQGNQVLIMKISNHLCLYQDYISTLYILEKDTREEFEKNFGYEILFENIISITYGRKCLYKAS